MLAYVLNKDGKPLMPCKSSKARKLLQQRKAKVIKREPFTIQLLYGSSGYKQNITLGIDAGSKHIGLSATTETKEVYASDVELRTDIVNLLATRRQNRRTRRNRLRYRKPRFQNRVHTKKKGWLAPSIKQKIQCHLKVVEHVYKLLPITKIIVEVASFDIQKIQNPTISGKEYQQGEQLGFWNVREYVLWRDNHSCQCCKGKSKDNILNVHHIESRKVGGDAPNNLITLCETCHQGYHKGSVTLPKTIKRGMTFKDATFMGIMRWTFYNQLKETYPNVSVGIVKAVIHRTAESDWVIKSATISQESDGTFYASVLFEYDTQESTPMADKEYAIGLDYASDGLYVDDTGNIGTNHKYYRESQKKLAKEQRKLSRKIGSKKGESKSNNYKKQLRKVNKIHRHIANQRLDHLHKKSTEIANQYDVVCIESLNMKAMSNKGFGNGKATLDNGYGLFQKLLEYKLSDRGKWFVKVDKWFASSQICHGCGKKHPEMKDFSIRTMKCVCGMKMDRDQNAAINIKREGLRKLKAEA